MTVKDRGQGWGSEAEREDAAVSEQLNRLLEQMGVGVLFDRLGQMPLADRALAVRRCMAVLSIADEVEGRASINGSRGYTIATFHHEYESTKAVAPSNSTRTCSSQAYFDQSGSK